MVQFHQKYFIESITCESVNPDQIRKSNFTFRNIKKKTESKLTRLLTYPEREHACNYTKPIYKTQYSEIFVEFEQCIDMNTGKKIIHPMATHRSTSDENHISQ